VGKPVSALLNVLLTLLGWIPGMIHALVVVSGHKADVRSKRIERAMYASAAANLRQAPPQ
jgi:hypothetical protein